MSKRILDYDPLTKTKTIHHYDWQTDTTHIETVQDVSGILKRTKALANDSSYKRQGIKSDWYHFATVPNVVLLELKTKYGLDYNNKDDLPKIEKVISTDYKYLLTVDKI